MRRCSRGQQPGWRAGAASTLRASLGERATGEPRGEEGETWGLDSPRSPQQVFFPPWDRS